MEEKWWIWKNSSQKSAVSKGTSAVWMSTNHEIWGFFDGLMVFPSFFWEPPEQKTSGRWFCYRNLSQMEIHSKTPGLKQWGLDMSNQPTGFRLKLGHDWMVWWLEQQSEDFFVICDDSTEVGNQQTWCVYVFFMVALGGKHACASCSASGGFNGGRSIPRCSARWITAWRRSSATSMASMEMPLEIINPGLALTIGFLPQNWVIKTVKTHETLKTVEMPKLLRLKIGT